MSDANNATAFAQDIPTSTHFGQDDRGLEHTPTMANQGSVINPHITPMPSTSPTPQACVPPMMSAHTRCNISPPTSPDLMNGACMQPVQNPISTWPRGVKVSPPPAVGDGRYDTWKKEFLLWRELYGFLPE